MRKTLSRVLHWPSPPGGAVPRPPVPSPPLQGGRHLETHFWGQGLQALPSPGDERGTPPGAGQLSCTPDGTGGAPAVCVVAPNPV